MRGLRRRRNRLGRLVPGLSLAAASGALVGAPRLAQAGDPYAISPSLSFQVAFGRQTEVGVALEVAGSYLFDSGGCTNVKVNGVGAYGQVGWLNRSGWRVGLGGQGFGELSHNQFLVGGQLGWVYHFGRGGTAPWHGVRFGVLPQLSSENLPLGLQLPVGLEVAPAAGTVEAQLALAVAAPPLAGLPFQCQVIIGRPLRQGGAQHLAEVRCVGESPVPVRGSLPAEIAAALTDAWLLDARAETSAISAFVALARDLSAAGAPAHLVAAALDAAEDEIDHAHRCAALAERYAGLRFQPVVAEIAPASDETSEERLARLAVESWLDGCLGEGAAAQSARRAAAGASDAWAQQAQAAIAEDEQRHADLGWAIVDWSLRAGGEAVREALRGAVSSTDESVSPRPERLGPAPTPLLPAHGRSNALDDARGAERLRVAARRRARALLG